MKSYKVVTDKLKSEEFNNHKDASEFCIKNKGMMYKRIDKKWIKHKHYSEMDLRVKVCSYNYTEDGDSVIYKCKKCNKINITVNQTIRWCSHCNGNLIKIYPLDF